jgi:hypothetical protein
MDVSAPSDTPAGAPPSADQSRVTATVVRESTGVRSSPPGARGRGPGSAPRRGVPSGRWRRRRCRRRAGAAAPRRRDRAPRREGALPRGCQGHRQRPEEVGVGDAAQEGRERRGELGPPLPDHRLDGGPGSRRGGARRAARRHVGSTPRRASPGASSASASAATGSGSAPIPGLSSHSRARPAAQVFRPLHRSPVRAGAPASPGSLLVRGRPG